MNDLQSRFRHGLAVAPERVALRVGSVELTYAQLHERALCEAGSLLRATGGVRRVGVLADRTPAAYIGLLATLYAGATVVPLNVGYPVARTAAMVTAAGVDAIIADRRGGALLAEVYRITGPVPTALIDDDAPAVAGLSGIARSDAHRLGRPATGTGIAYLMFTSGSTGAPKGVPVSHANVDHFLRCCERRYRFQPGEVFSQTFDHTFDLSVFDLFVAWGAAGTLVTVPRFAVGRLASVVRRHQITVWFSVPSSILVAHRTGGLAPGSMPSLRWSLFCGEALRGEDAQRWLAAAPNATLENLYGPTELTIACSVHRVDPQRLAGSLVNGVVPIGDLVDGSTGVLLDARPWKGVSVAAKMASTGA